MFIPPSCSLDLPASPRAAAALPATFRAPGVSVRSLPRTAVRALSSALVALLSLAAGAQTVAAAPTRVLFVGDSITQGGQGYASYRYALYFDLLVAGYDVDFVGPRDAPHNNVSPQSGLYPNYDTTFDRDHAGYWGWRTDQVEALIQGIAFDAQPEVVVIHLGTNDVGQQGAAGVSNADANLRDIIGLIRLEVPTATFLVSKVVPLGAGAGGSYGANAGQVGPLNTAIEGVVADLDAPQSPVLLVDPNLGFDLATQMQGDQIHPNEFGEQFIADAFRIALEAVLPAGNPAPSVALTAPADGAVVIAPATFELAAAASDVNGSVVEVRFFADGAPIGADALAPYGVTWTPSPGSYQLTAVAEDDGGATRTSAPVAVTVLPPGSAVPVAVVNPSFEEPALGDGVVRNNSGIDGWTFTGTSATFR
ncbi:MAG: Ig-like domain-containing protein, partial [Acidobacteriota bacterium]